MLKQSAELKCTTNKHNFKFWNENLTKMYDSYDLSLNQPFVPGKETRSNQKKSLLDLKPNTILTIGIDHKSNKILNKAGEPEAVKVPKNKMVRVRGGVRKDQGLPAPVALKNQEEELMYLVRKFDL